MHGTLAKYHVFVDDNWPTLQHRWQAAEVAKTHMGFLDTMATRANGPDRARIPRSRMPHAACREIIDRSLDHVYRSGMTDADLYGSYVDAGDDPFVEGDISFSGWEYARERAGEICTST